MMSHPRRLQVLLSYKTVQIFLVQVTSVFCFTNVHINIKVKLLYIYFKEHFALKTVVQSSTEQWPFLGPANIQVVVEVLTELCRWNAWHGWRQQSVTEWQTVQPQCQILLVFNLSLQRATTDSARTGNVLSAGAIHKRCDQNGDSFRYGCLVGVFYLSASVMWVPCTVLCVPCTVLRVPGTVLWMPWTVLLKWKIKSV
jgi:hypothetical protein